MFFKKKDNEDNICRFCVYATLTENGEKAICSHRGEVDLFFACRKFSYDILKRDPGRQQIIEPMEYIDINN